MTAKIWLQYSLAETQSIVIQLDYPDGNTYRNTVSPDTVIHLSQTNFLEYIPQSPNEHQELWINKELPTGIKAVYLTSEHRPDYGSMNQCLICENKIKHNSISLSPILQINMDSKVKFHIHPTCLSELNAIISDHIESNKSFYTAHKI